ncbi:unnamed protein product [Alopecurus aequalis]
MVMRGRSGSMSPSGTGDMGAQSMSISSLVSSAGGGGVRGFIFTDPLIGTAAISSSFTVTVASGGGAGGCACAAKTVSAWLDGYPAVALASLYTTKWRSSAVPALSSSLYTTGAVRLMLSSSYAASAVGLMLSSSYTTSARSGLAASSDDVLPVRQCLRRRLLAARANRFLSVLFQ